MLTPTVQNMRFGSTTMRDNMDPRKTRYETPKHLIWDEENLARFWAYQSQFPENYFSFQMGADVLRRARACLPQGSHVLDYGCGPGHLLPHLLHSGYFVTAADVSLEAMGSIEANVASNPRFKGITTIDSLLAQKQTFEGIFLLEVIEHLDDRWLETTFDNARRLLTKNGVLIVTTPNDEHLEDSMVYCPVSNLLFHRWQHVRSWSADTLTAALRHHGFNSVTVGTCNFQSVHTNHVSPFRRLVHRMALRMRKPQSLFAIARIGA